MLLYVIKGKKTSGIYFAAVFALIKDLPSKIILGTLFMALFYPFLVTDEGIKTNVLRKDIFFRFIVPPVLKEKHSSKNVTILTDINERGIYRTETSLSPLKTEILLIDQLTENDKKKVKQDKEIEICSYSLIAFLHKVQSTKVLSRKGIKDGNMDTIFCNQYAWTNSIWIDRWQLEAIAPTPNIENTDSLIKEALIDSIEEHINCGNFLNKDKFNFLTNEVNHTSLIDFP